MSGGKPLDVSSVLCPSKMSYPENEPILNHCGGGEWLDGLGVWFSLRVREVPGSIPGQAQHILINVSLVVKIQMEMSGIEPEAF